jgi:hypothetical protein
MHAADASATRAASLLLDRARTRRDRRLRLDAILPGPARRLGSLSFQKFASSPAGSAAWLGSLSLQKVVLRSQNESCIRTSRRSMPM